MNKHKVLLVFRHPHFHHVHAETDEWQDKGQRTKERGSFSLYEMNSNAKKE